MAMVTGNTVRDFFRFYRTTPFENQTGWAHSRMNRYLVANGTTMVRVQPDTISLRQRAVVSVKRPNWGNVYHIIYWDGEAIYDPIYGRFDRVPRWYIIDRVDHLMDADIVPSP